jgi:F-type H+-transporting ATPase subunit delta
MSRRTSATRYAKALLDVAVQESDPAVVERDLATMVDAVTKHAELGRLMRSPGTPQSVRVNVIGALAQRAGVQPPVAKLLTMLAARGRLEVLPDLLEVYRERLLAHRKVIRATVTSAVPLSPDKVARLEATLRNLTGQTVQLHSGVDPSIIGGIVTRIGSTVYDGSIRTQLEKMRQQLVQKT